MSHYFRTPASGTSRPGTVRLEVSNQTLELATDAGVFSRTRIDPGTTVLLEVLPDLPPTGAMLDLGCGYGPIALALAIRSPHAEVWSVDVNERARRLCAQNALSAGLMNVHVCAPNEVPQGVMFTSIVSNPPVRIGRGALRDLLLHWLRRLEPGGEAYLVVQKHLGSDSLQQWLNCQDWPTTRIASRRGFRVLRCRMPDVR